MEHTLEKRDPLEELMEQIHQLLNCNGITRVMKTSASIHALVDGTTPVLINLVPNQQRKKGEFILQIYFTLSKLSTTNTSLLLDRLDKLSPYLALGSLCFLPDQEIGYKCRMPLNINAPDQAITNFTLSFQLMSLFLLRFLPYVQTLAKNPESITLEQYLIQEG